MNGPGSASATAPDALAAVTTPPITAHDDSTRAARPAQAARRGYLFRKYVASFVLVVSIALITNGTLDIWFSFQEQKQLLIRVQRVQAQAAAAKIGGFVNAVEHEMGWIALLPSNAATPDELRINAIRLLRQAPAIIEIAQLDRNGREQLRVSRVARDVVGSSADLSDRPAFREAVAKGVYHGPVYFVRQSEPYMTIAVAGPGSGAIVAEVNLKFIWDVVSQLAVGARGGAYVTDAQGRLIAHPDLRQVLRNTDLSGLVQVQAARSGAHAGATDDVVEDLEQRKVLSAHATVAPLGWLVFVELPIDEAFAPIYGSIMRSAAVLAGLFLARRMVVPIQALTDGAARIGQGDHAQRLSIKTGDELEALGDQFNRMAGQLQDSYATLEHKVAERTAELAQARDRALTEHAEAARARQAAEIANATKSRFLAVVSHEIRTPMNGVLGVLALLDRTRLAADQHRLVEMAEASGETLLSLIDGILDYARLEAGTELLEPRDFDLRRVVEAAVGLIRPQAAAKGLSLDLVMDDGSNARLHGDPVRLNRVLLNLVSNAVKFTSDGGICVDVALDPPQQDRVWLRIAVADTGIGIAPEDQERIFQDFVQADDTIARRFGGTGLGLAISRRIAVLMGGELTVESKLGAGSTFRFAVPLALAREAAAPSDAPAAGRSLAVLLVDDDAMNREVAAAMLGKLGHRPTVATDGTAAIEAARCGAFDVALMDLHMPGMNGIEAVERIRALPIDPMPRFIMLTADVSEESRRRLAQAGLDAMVAKPLSSGALRAALAASEDDDAEFARPIELDPDNLVDTAFLAQQCDLLGATRLRALTDLFREGTGGLTATLTAALDRDDRLAIRHVAHQLGSAASALALGRLFAHTELLEAQASDAARDTLAAAIAGLATLSAQSIDALEARLRDA
jgi:signal transduction histidine kinase/ActR/RegA family two-component response regulator